MHDSCRVTDCSIRVCPDVLCKLQIQLLEFCCSRITAWCWRFCLKLCQYRNIWAAQKSQTCSTWLSEWRSYRGSWLSCLNGSYALHVPLWHLSKLLKSYSCAILHIKSLISSFIMCFCIKTVFYFRYSYCSCCVIIS